MPARGITLLELSVSIGITSLVISGAALLFSIEMDSARQADTIAKLEVFKRAIIGDARIVTRESRTDFGYFGDMGSLPGTISDLWNGLGSKPAYVYNSTKKTGAGWAGPYVQVGPVEFVSSLTRDAWGNGIQYIVQTGTSSVTGQEYRARIFSYGANGSLGGGDDITAEIYTTELYSRVVGYIRDSSGNPIANVPIKMNYPSLGALQTSTTNSNADGSYSFAAVPFGNRSITIEPRLVYSDGSGVTTGSGGNNVEFVMTSFTCGTITSATATFDTTAFFTRLIINNTTVFNNTTNLAANGELVTFSTPVDVSWSGCGGGGTVLSQVVPVRLQSPLTQAPDKSIGAGASAGKNIRVRMNTFESLENGSGSSVDMTGASISVTFSDGSVATFSPISQ